MRTSARRLGFFALLLAAIAAIGVYGLAASAATKAAPTNAQPPAISGTPTEGQALTASTGNWNGTTPITYAYSWRRCDKTGGSCSAISGATASSYTLASVDVGNTVRVRVTASNSSGSNNSTSVPSAVVAAAPATTTDDDDHYPEPARKRVPVRERPGQREPGLAAGASPDRRSELLAVGDREEHPELHPPRDDQEHVRAAR